MINRYKGNIDNIIIMSSNIPNEDERRFIASSNLFSDFTMNISLYKVSSISTDINISFIDKAILKSINACMINYKNFKEPIKNSINNWYNSNYNRYIIKGKKNIEIIQNIPSMRLKVENDEIESIEVLMFGEKL